MDSGMSIFPGDDDEIWEDTPMLRAMEEPESNFITDPTPQPSRPPSGTGPVTDKPPTGTGPVTNNPPTGTGTAIPKPEPQPQPKPPQPKPPQPKPPQPKPDQPVEPVDVPNDENPKADKEEIKQDIKNIIKNRYPDFEFTDQDIEDFFNDEFIKKDNIDIKDFILRLMVLEKVFKMTYESYNNIDKIIKRLDEIDMDIKRLEVIDSDILRLENHFETIRRNMLTMAKKIDIQTGIIKN
ncbi:MV attachment protein [Cotia virus SPAn232]|uniref:MV attachment protein n=2 Tax=Cotia virus TaxID=39444 RepID=H6TAA4_9POXV|nr:MV attachment protein [Cotia virus SPAn232]ADT91144.1 MV attachment protein [Cotia virus SPAn232]AIT70749.1 MV attachment protein [Cotia virus]